MELFSYNLLIVLVFYVDNDNDDIISWFYMCLCTEAARL